jgi:hypothetical protein
VVGEEQVRQLGLSVVRQSAVFALPCKIVELDALARGAVVGVAAHHHDAPFVGQAFEE